MNNQNNNSINYHNISLLVRPARVAILINEKDTYWKHIILNVFEWCSRVWGGAYFLIVPTDGIDIKAPFWKILEEYSPDHIYSFIPTIKDLESADPQKYKRIITKYEKAFFQQFPELKVENYLEVVDRDINPEERYKFEIDDLLQQQLKQRLTPFYFNEYIVQEHISAQAHVPFPLTQLENIVQQGNLEKVYVVDHLEDIDCSLTFYSNWGSFSTDFELVLTEKGVEVNHIPKEARLADLIHFSVNKRVDTTDIEFRKLYQKGIGDKDDSWYPDEDIVRYCPYEASLLKIGKYKVLEPHYTEEPVTLIVGDTVADFCLYYCLSRIQDAVFWLPEVTPLTKTNKHSKPDARTILSMTAGRVIAEHVHFGRSNNTIAVSSLSLNEDELEHTRKRLPQLFSLDDGIAQRIAVEATPWLLEKSTIRLIEQNNYTNQYTEVFQNNKGIGRLPTPRPKNFGQVIPYDHRWITEFNIEGFTPPQLHFLGKEIVDLRGSTTETRISRTGICYTCPNIGYFGGDIDVTLVRPRINIIEPLVIFQEYFGEAGYADVRLSDKGGFSKEIIEKFGSLDGIGGFLKEKCNRDLLSLFLRKKSLKSSINGEMVYANNRVYIDFHAIQYLIGTEKETIQLIDRFTSTGILFRGTMLHCSRCREADWYGLEELNQAYICHRCKQKQNIEQKNWKDGKEPTWFYKLDEVIYQGVKNDEVLPLLTLTHLKTKAKSSFLYVPELEIRKNASSSSPDREVDISCIVDGRIILGECRKGGIDKKIINKLNEFSSRLLKSPDLLVFATLSNEVSDEIVTHTKSTVTIPFSILKASDLVKIE